MPLARAVFWNTFIQFAGRAVSTALGLVVLAIMTRSLGPAGFGGYTTAIAFLQFFAIIADFGLTLTANRMLGEIKIEEVEERRSSAASRLMSNLMTLRFFSALVFLGFTPFIAYFFFPYPAIVKQSIILAVFSFFAIIMTQTLVPVFQKNLRMDKVALSETAGRIVLLIGVSLCAWFKLDLLWYIGVIVLASLVNYLSLRSYVHQFIRLKWSFDFVLWRRIIVLSWPIGISIIFNLVYLKADTIILSVLRSQSEVGFYGAAYRVLDILTGLATMFMGIVLPLLTAAWASSNRGRFRYLLQKSFDAMTFMALPTLLIGVLLSKPIMAFVGGQEFIISGDILAVLILAMGAVFFSTLFGHVVVVLNKQKAMIWGYAADAILSLAAYFLLIPRFGVWGAAWGTVFSEVLMVILTFWMVAKTSRIIPSLKTFGKAVFSAFVAGAIILLIRDFNWVLAGVVGLAVYLSLLYFTRAVTKELLREIFSLKTKTL